MKREPTHFVDTMAVLTYHGMIVSCMELASPGRAHDVLKVLASSVKYEYSFGSWRLALRAMTSLAGQSRVTQQSWSSKGVAGRRKVAERLRPAPRLVGQRIGHDGAQRRSECSLVQQEGGQPLAHRRKHKSTRRCECGRKVRHVYPYDVIGRGLAVKHEMGSSLVSSYFVVQRK